MMKIKTNDKQISSINIKKELNMARENAIEP